MVLQTSVEKKQNPATVRGRKAVAFYAAVLFGQFRHLEFAEDPPTLFLLIYLSEGLVVMLFIDVDLLNDRKNVKDKIVEIESGREAVEEQRKHDWHHPDHHFLAGVLHGHFLLDEHRNAHQERKAAQLSDPKQGNGERKRCNNIRNR